MTPLAKQRLKDFGRNVTYQIAGLPMAVRAIFIRRNSTPEAVIRHAYARRFWRPRSIGEFGCLALAIVLWPFVLAGLEIAFVLKNGRVIAQRFGRPVRRQLLDQLKLYLTAGALPPWYYIFELHRHPTSEYARDFIYRWESKAGVGRLLKEGKLAPSSEVANKAEFADFCLDHDVRAVPVLALFRAQLIELKAPVDALETDLFIKPILGRGGKGAERWDWTNGLYHSPRGRWLTRQQLLERFRKRSASCALLVQPRLRNHPVLEPLNNGALSTVRVLTCLDERGEPEPMAAAMRMAIGSNCTVDNLHSGGIAAEVDLDTGELGPTSNLGADSRLGWLQNHPDSGAAIEGFRLPIWNEVRKFAVHAHRAFGDRILVGWDIAVTPDGPVLVEANGGPDLDIHQRVSRHGLMSGRLGELLAFHLTRLGLVGMP